jgi:hypothetical protein
MNTRSGIDIQYLITKNNIQEIVHSIEYYCQANEHNFYSKNRFFRSLLCTSGKRLGNYLRSIEIIVKLLYLINSFIQLILIYILLGQSKWFDIWYNLFIKNSVLTDSPYFPRVTLCDLRIREIGNIHQYTIQCVLPINMLNEKIFSFICFWFIFLFLSNLFSFISTLIFNHQISFIRDLYRINSSKIIINEILFEKFLREFLKQDGRLIIYLIHHNGQAFLASEIVQYLYRNYQQRYQLRKVDSTDV